MCQLGSQTHTDSDLLCRVKRRGHRSISLFHIILNQMSSLQLESEIIHGTFSMREKM